MDLFFKDQTLFLIIKSLSLLFHNLLRSITRQGVRLLLVQVLNDHHVAEIGLDQSTGVRFEEFLTRKGGHEDEVSAG